MIRVSGPNAIDLIGKVWRGKQLSEATPRTALFGHIIDGGTTLDEAVVTVYKAPASYTGDDVVEISVHGSPYIQHRLISILTVDPDKCRVAKPGEFTRRAFLAGKLDLAQSEAVADIIASTSKGAHLLAMKQLRGSLSKRIEELREKLLTLASLLELELDFSEEDVEFASRSELKALCDDAMQLIGSLVDSFQTGRAIVNGLRVAIVGAPNAGKSTLLNRLLDDEKAIVSDLPGTTRDIIEDTIEIDGILFRFIDTAGLRENPTDIVEKTGISRALNQIDKAHIVMPVVDATVTPEINLATIRSLFDKAKDSGAVILPVINKVDIADKQTVNTLRQEIKQIIQSSRVIDSDNETDQAVTHSHYDIPSLNIIRQRLSHLGHEILDANVAENAVLTNARHYQAASEALQELRNTSQAIDDSLTGEIISLHLRSAIDNLASITGQITNPEILTTIFSRFCIGK